MCIYTDIYIFTFVYIAYIHIYIYIGNFAMSTSPSSIVCKCLQRSKWLDKYETHIPLVKIMKNTCKYIKTFKILQNTSTNNETKTATYQHVYLPAHY